MVEGLSSSKVFKSFDKETLCRDLMEKLLRTSFKHKDLSVVELIKKLVDNKIILFDFCFQVQTLFCHLFKLFNFNFSISIFRLQFFNFNFLISIFNFNSLISISIFQFRIMYFLFCHIFILKSFHMESI